MAPLYRFSYLSISAGGGSGPFLNEARIPTSGESGGKVPLAVRRRSFLFRVGIRFRCRRFADP